jgi:hypothetical protein
VNVAVIVAVDVIAPVIVAALGNGNDTVAVIDTVNAPAPYDGGSTLSISARPSGEPDP